MVHKKMREQIRDGQLGGLCLILTDHSEFVNSHVKKYVIANSSSLKETRFLMPI